MVSVQRFHWLCPSSVQRHPGLRNHTLSPWPPRRQSLVLRFGGHVRQYGSSPPKAPGAPKFFIGESPALEKAAGPSQNDSFFQPFNGTRWSRAKTPSLENWRFEDEMSEVTEAFEATELDNEAQETKPLPAARAWRDSMGQRLYSGLMRFLPTQARRKKADLHNTNVLAWEQGNAKVLAWAQGLQNRPRQVASLSFESNLHLRRVMISYILNIEPIFHPDALAIGLPGRDALLEETLNSFFNDSVRRVLNETGYSVSDVACWSWVFTAPAVDLAIIRYALLADDFRNCGDGRRMPKFVILQLLRSASISPFALKRLIDSLLADLRVCQQKGSYVGWNWVTRVCLVVRLIRQARRFAPNRFEDIGSIISHLFSDYYRVHATELDDFELEKLAHIFNRFLMLIAFATAQHAFGASLKQQNVQLTLIRSMVAFKPPIPVTREGYRALIKLQLLHRKTQEERAWADAKSPSWPPWREDQLGIQEDIEYAGKESRAMRLLRRMKEAGYAHGAWEQSASILAGWDTDKSPTIQTRSILQRPNQPWLLDGKSSKDEDVLDHELWTARIRSTRSKLEAWAAFSAYAKIAPVAKRQYWPYYAMLERLMTQTVQPNSALGSSYVPGDVKETFPDPKNPNDVIYVEHEVPAADDFYEQMLRDGFKPAGRLLCSLLDSARNLEDGFRYIKDCKWNEVTKDIILHAEKYSYTTVQKTFTNLPIQFLAAFSALLCRNGFATHPPLFEPCSTAINEFNSSRDSALPTKFEIRPLLYAEQLMKISGVKDMRVWNSLLKGLGHTVAEANRQAKEQGLSGPEVLSVKTGVWRRVDNVFSATNFQKLELHPDLDTFRHVAWLVELLLDDIQFRRPQAEYLANVTKSIFVHAVCGQNSMNWLNTSSATAPLSVPEARDLRQMVRILLCVHDLKGLIALLKWLNHHVSTFKSFAEHPEPTSRTDTRSELPHLRGTLCAVRLFLEGSQGLNSSEDSEALWFETPLQVSEKDVVQARQICQPLGWPTDEETNFFLMRNDKWIAKVAKAADLTRMKEASYARRHTRTKDLVKKE